MNTLSSLPPPSFGAWPASPLAPADAASRGLATPAALDDIAGGAPLHVSSAAAPRALDDIERDFLAALCENPPA